ncbi:MAG: GNAT family N-acetyltransferase [Candidatus Methanosuratincola sp.]
MNTLHITPIGLEEYQEWFEYNHANLQGRSPFHHPVWMETVGRALRYKTRYLAVFEKGDLTTVIPGFLYSRGPMRMYGSPLRGTMTSYLGPITIKSNLTDEERIALLEMCTSFIRKEWRVAYCRYTLRNAPSDAPMLASNWNNQRPGSYRLDLSKGIEEIWKGLKSDCRRNIRRAREAGMEIVPFEDAGLFYRMIDATFRRHSSTSFHKEKFFHALISELVPRDLLWAWGVKYQGEIIAGAFFLHDDREAHFISGASNPEFGSLPTSYLLHWSAIETSVKNGLAVFNSEKSRIPSIDQFKESFRPVLEKRYTLISAPGYLYSAQKLFIKGYARLRKINSLIKRRQENLLPSP